MPTQRQTSNIYVVYVVKVIQSRDDSVPMSTRWQPSNPCLQLGLLDCHFNDIGMKLHSVNFAVKFSSALALENLTAKYTLCNFISSCTKFNQIGISPIGEIGAKGSLPKKNQNVNFF